MKFTRVLAALGLMASTATGIEVQVEDKGALESCVSVDKADPFQNPSRTLLPRLRMAS